MSGKATRIQHTGRIKTLLERSGDRSARTQIAKHIPTRFDGSRRSFAYVTTTSAASDRFDVAKDRFDFTFVRRGVERKTRIHELKPRIREQRGAARSKFGNRSFEPREKRADPKTQAEWGRHFCLEIADLFDGVIRRIACAVLLAEPREVAFDRRSVASEFDHRPSTLPRRSTRWQRRA